MRLLEPAMAPLLLLKRPVRSAAAGSAGGAAAVVDLAVRPGLAATGVDVLDVLDVLDVEVELVVATGTSAELPGAAGTPGGTPGGTSVGKKYCYDQALCPVLKLIYSSMKQPSIK